MNKTFSKTLVAASTALMISSVAVADEQKFGVGVSVNQDTTKIRGVINLDKTMRLEPFLGFRYNNINNNSNTTLEIGTAFHLLQSINSNMNAYYGGYVGYTDVNSGLALGPVAGVEYALDPQFTLGAEVRVDIGFGDVTNIGTNSEVILRYYF